MFGDIGPVIRERSNAYFNSLYWIVVVIMFARKVTGHQVHTGSPGTAEPSYFLVPSVNFYYPLRERHRVPPLALLNTCKVILIAWSGEAGNFEYDRWIYFPVTGDVGNVDTAGQKAVIVSWMFTFQRCKYWSYAGAMLQLFHLDVFETTGMKAGCQYLGLIVSGVCEIHM